jgi:hypothetical protein
VRKVLSLSCRPWRKTKPVHTQWAAQFQRAFKLAMEGQDPSIPSRRLPKAVVQKAVVKNSSTKPCCKTAAALSCSAKPKPDLMEHWGMRWGWRRATLHNFQRNFNPGLLLLRGFFFGAQWWK